MKYFAYILIPILLVTACCSREKETKKDQRQATVVQLVPDTFYLLAYALNFKKIAFCGNDTLPITSLNIQFEPIEYDDSLKCNYYYYYFFSDDPNLSCYIFNCYCTLLQDSLGRITPGIHALKLKYKREELDELIKNSISDLRSYLFNAKDKDIPISNWLRLQTIELDKESK